MDRRQDDIRVALLEKELAQVRTELAEEKIGTKELKSRVEEIDKFIAVFNNTSKLTKWFSGFLITVVSILLAKITLLNKLFGGN